MSPIGRIHSLESFGTHEGPGIRYVVFMQGCQARCRYCQNPDTWRPEEGKGLTAEEVFGRILKCVPYFQASGGGVTASGGEPLLQAGFLEELFGMCRGERIHTAIDTSGFIAPGALDALGGLIELTDLFLIDLKWADPAGHKALTGRSLQEPLALIERLERLERPYWIRHVLVPGLNDGEGDLLALKGLMAPLRQCARFELLPYHNLGVHKWEELGLEYTLKGTPCAEVGDTERALRILG